jgi:hypothetical protein
MWSLPNGSGEQPPAKEQVKGIARLIPTFINTIGQKRNQHRVRPANPQFIGYLNLIIAVRHKNVSICRTIRVLSVAHG